MSIFRFLDSNFVLQTGWFWMLLYIVHFVCLDHTYLFWFPLHIVLNILPSRHSANNRMYLVQLLKWWYFKLHLDGVDHLLCNLILWSENLLLGFFSILCSYVDKHYWDLRHGQGDNCKRHWGLRFHIWHFFHTSLLYMH